MSAAVCGFKRSFIDDNETASPSQPSKKLRCFSSSSSPVRCSLPTTSIRQLASTFPFLDFQILEKALAECGNNLDSAIKNLHEHFSSYGEEKKGSVEGQFAANMDKGSLMTDGDAFSNNLPVHGGEWVELFVREMTNATDVDDAKARVARALTGLEKCISMRADAEATQTFHKENVMLKDQLEVLMRENTILKRGVAIQHERQIEYDNKNRELQMLKQLVPQYQEQLRTLEVKNYTLSTHLTMMQQNNSINGHFNPDIF